MFCVHKNRPWRDVSYAVQADGGPVYRSKQMVVAYTTQTTRAHAYHPRTRKKGYAQHLPREPRHSASHYQDIRVTTCPI